MLQVEIPLEPMMQDDRLDASAIMVFAAIKIKQNSQGYRTTAWKEIAEELDTSKKTVQRKIKVLKDTGYIYVEDALHIFDGVPKKNVWCLC